MFLHNYNESEAISHDLPFSMEDIETVLEDQSIN